ncbi:MAG: hypothetical protein RL181_2453 [Bacteroidota bacterium]
MRVLIAADSFKDALSAQRVCRAIAEGFCAGFPAAEVREFPLADGGEGLSEVLAFHLGGEMVSVNTTDPLGRPCAASYLLAQGGGLAFLESAQAAGLERLGPSERNPLYTSTFGVGLLIRDAVRRGARQIYLGLGGTATNDAGTGMAAALGFVFRDAHGHALAPRGENLSDVAAIEASGVLPELLSCRFQALCDVNNPLFGPEGAAYTFAPQKGADPDAVACLDRGLRHICPLLEGAHREAYGQPLHTHLQDLPGSGAAGGLGAGVMAFLNGQLRPGSDAVLDMVGFDDAVLGADLILTGEGRLDGQTARGKLVHGVCQRAARYGVPVVALCGAVEASAEQVRSMGLLAAFSISLQPQPLERALENTALDLAHSAAQLGAIWRHWAQR